MVRPHQAEQSRLTTKHLFSAQKIRGVFLHANGDDTEKLFL